MSWGERECAFFAATIKPCKPAMSTCNKDCEYYKSLTGTYIGGCPDRIEQLDNIWCQRDEAPCPWQTHESVNTCVLRIRQEAGSKLWSQKEYNKMIRNRARGIRT